MEHLSGTIRIRDIFLDNGNWWKLFLLKSHLIRLAIIINVIKLLTCRTRALGFHRFLCPKCLMFLDAPHSCKSRLCPSCGKKATDQWIADADARLPKTTWQHISFTIPKDLQLIIWANRHLMGLIAPRAAELILDLAKKRNLLPGIFLAIHTFGRDLKRNYHIHLSTTAGGLSANRRKWIGGLYFHHSILKSLWKYAIVKLIRDNFNAGKLSFPNPIAHLADKKELNKLLDSLWKKDWVIHLNEQSSNRKRTIDYLGKYLKRPPIGETRIKAYDGNSVTFEYLDHYTGETAEMVLPSADFLERLISHIPDQNFRNIRYYGFLSNRTSGKLLQTVYSLLEQKMRKAARFTWRQMRQTLTGMDPVKCPHCGTRMGLVHIKFSININSLIKRHEEIANGYFQMV